VSAYRATDVKKLADALITTPQWRENLDHIADIVAEADVLVPCWGNRSKAPRHLHGDFDMVLAMLQTSGKPVRHFGLTASGDPKHPLMLGYSTPLVEFRALKDGQEK
jgi:hypothetical protein